MTIYFLLLVITSYCQSSENDVTFLGLLPLYNFFSGNRPVENPALSLYETLKPGMVSNTPKISPLVPVYAFLNHFGSSEPELETPKPTYIIPEPMVTDEEPSDKISTEPSLTTSSTSTSRPPIPPPPRPPPPPLPPPVTSSIIQDIYNMGTMKSKHPLPLSKPSGSGYRPYRPIKYPPTPPPWNRSNKKTGLEEKYVLANEEIAANSPNTDHKDYEDIYYEDIS